MAHCDGHLTLFYLGQRSLRQSLQGFQQGNHGPHEKERQERQGQDHYLPVEDNMRLVRFRGFLAGERDQHPKKRSLAGRGEKSKKKSRDHPPPSTSPRRDWATQRLGRRGGGRHAAGLRGEAAALRRGEADGAGRRRGAQWIGSEKEALAWSGV